MESCDIDFPEGAEMLPLGRVSHITEGLVVIESLSDTPPVDERTVLWSEAKKSISVVRLPLNKGHIGTSHFVHYREVVLFLMYSGTSE